MYPTPVPGAKGKYELEAPFAQKIDPNIAYECTAVRTFGEMQSWGRDPWTEVYRPENIDEAKYVQDAQDAVMLVTLRADRGQTVVVPTSYIKSCPPTGGVPYNVMAIAIKLGAIADEVELQGLMTKLADVTKANIGIEPEVRAVKLSSTTLRPQQDHEALEAARKANIISKDTLSSENLRLSQENARLREQIDALEQLIS